MELFEIIDKYEGDIELFNSIVSKGRKPIDFKVDVLIDRMKLQMKITQEELDEAVKAKEENDLVEYYDGLADVVFTATYLLHLDEVLLNKWGVGEGDLSFSDESKKLGNDITTVLSYKDINLNLLDKCLRLVVENNKQKFTTSKEDFDTWESEFIRKELVVDGVTYYTLVDESGKVRKRKNFPKVDLSFVLDEV